MSERKIEVLVAEDSAVSAMLLVHLLEADPAVRVIGTVTDGHAAVEFVLKRKPDVVLMDIHMPRLNGFEATRRIMETRPVPIVVCSAVSNTEDAIIAFEAMQAGALACIEKPQGHGRSDFAATAANLVQTVKLMSEVRVVRRFARTRAGAVPAAEPVPARSASAQIRIIGIGASTGGPPVLQTILEALPNDLSVPVLIVQHIAQGFLPGMAEWLSHSTGLRVHVATSGTYALPGHVYLAPDDFHMGISAGGVIMLSRAEAINHLRPSVAFLFQSLARAYGPAAVGVLLTGMGRDGAEELKMMKDRGAITIAQDRESSVVHGMPGVAIALGAATHVAAADKIAALLVSVVDHKDRPPTA